MNADGCAECFYCRMPLAGRHEHDHAPIAKRHGGQDTVPACHNCHSLKDRVPVSNWPVPLMVKALNECGPLGRIFLAKAFTVERDRADANATHTLPSPVPRVLGSRHALGKCGPG